MAQSNFAGLGNEKSKWDLLSANDKRKFFNFWYILMLAGDVFQVIVAIDNLVFPLFDEFSQLMMGFSCLLAWISVGAFIDSKDLSSTVYQLLIRIAKPLLKYLLVFCIIFTGFAMMCKCTTCLQFLCSFFDVSSHALPQHYEPSDHYPVLSFVRRLIVQHHQQHFANRSV